MLVEKTFQKHNVKKIKSDLTDEQKARLRDIVNDMEGEVKTFLQNAETKRATAPKATKTTNANKNNNPPSSPQIVQEETVAKTLEIMRKPYLYRKKKK